MCMFGAPPRTFCQSVVPKHLTIFNLLFLHQRYCTIEQPIGWVSVPSPGFKILYMASFVQDRMAPRNSPYSLGVFKGWVWTSLRHRWAACKLNGLSFTYVLKPLAEHLILFNNSWRFVSRMWKNSFLCGKCNDYSCWSRNFLATGLL